MDDGASPKLSYAEKNNWFSDFLRKLNRKNADKITEREIISMVNEGQETGVLQANEVEMIQNRGQRYYDAPFEYMCAGWNDESAADAGSCLGRDIFKISGIFGRHR